MAGKRSTTDADAREYMLDALRHIEDVARGVHEVADGVGGLPGVPHLPFGRGCGEPVDLIPRPFGRWCGERVGPGPAGPSTKTDRRARRRTGTGRPAKR
jgi:hypothetical protein